MPKPEGAEEVKEEEKTSEITETKDGGVEVSVEAPITPKEEVQEEPTVIKEEVVANKPKVTDDQSWRNKVFAQDRIIQKLNRDIEEIRNRAVIEPSSVKQEVNNELDDIDKLAQTDWKAAVNKLAERKAREILDNEREHIQEQQEKISVQTTMETNAKFVTSKHQELDDPDSEKSQIFQSILSNNPRWRTSPDGPLLVMYEMENELRKKGYDIDGKVGEKVANEVTRLTRASSTSLPASRKPLLTNKIVLTREQREFCDQNGMSYEDYARTLSKSRGKEGIEI
jgi:hypothetical protein